MFRLVLLFLLLFPYALNAQIAGTIQTSAKTTPTKTVVQQKVKKETPKQVETSQKEYTPMQIELVRQIQHLNLKNNPIMVQNYYLTMQAIQKTVDKNQKKDLDNLKEDKKAQQNLKEHFDTQTPIRFTSFSDNPEDISKTINEKPEEAMIAIVSNLSFMNSNNASIENSESMIERLKKQFEIKTGLTIDEYHQTMEDNKTKEKTIKGEQLPSTPISKIK